MKRLVGEIDVHPWLYVPVETQAGRKKIKFLVDTGFDGEIAVPRSYIPWFGTSGEFYDTEFANGTEEEAMVVRCRIEWMGQWRTVDVMYLDCKHPLLGMELFDNCVITLEIENKRGEIIVETIE